MQPPQLNSRAAGSCAWRPWLLRLSSGRPAALAGWRRRTHAAGAGPAQPAMPLGVAAQAAAAAAAPEVDAPPAPGPPGSEASEAAVAESFTLLEWPALCGQVACFTQTTAGAEVALSCRLPIGRTQAESEQMLQETAEAQRADLMLKGVFDIRRALDAARAGLVLHPLVLGAVALTLEAAQRVDAALHAVPGSFSALLQLAAGLRGGAPAVQQALAQCIQASDGRILDSASERLAAVRAERRENMQELRRRVDEWARQLHAKGVSERPQVVIRRDRLCIPVRAGRQGELPKGSLTLATSASGSTLYMEPQPVVGLNNREMALAGEEAEEEERVLTALSQLVAAHADGIQRMVDSLTALDLATARARHASWLGASRPSFLSAEEAAAVGLVSIPHAWHPLLLQPCLPALPAPPAVELRPTAGPPGPNQNGSGAVEGDQDLSAAGVGLVPELVQDAAASEPAPKGPRAGGQQPAGAQQDGSGPARPVPTDLRVPPGVGVVAVTGPNTGGKTASLKALGLLSLMAKAGCFIPQAPAAAGEAEAATAGPRLVWFDQVLADLGDGQSLQQSLSTFSGHVRRIRNILAAVTPRSLVLLDEVGSGTDPTEGAALASALLERLHARAALTYATTHHAELKELASTTPGFVNASVEFDIATLRPTYRLLWGRAGESNALAVAQGLGFSPAVVAQARQVAAALHAAPSTAQRSQQLQRSLEDELEEGQQQAQAAAAARRAAEARLAEAQQQERALAEEVQALAKAAKQAKAKANEEGPWARLAKVLGGARSGAVPVEEAEEAIRAVEREAAAAKQAGLALVGLRVAKEAGLDFEPAPEAGGAAARSTGGLKKWVPRQGEVVRVLKMGGAPGTVISASGPAQGGGGGGRKLSVRVGGLTLEMRSSDVAPMNGSGGGGKQAAATGGGKRSGGSGGSSSSGGGAAGRQRSSGRAEMAKAKERLRAEGAVAAGSGVQEEQATPGVAIAVQTSRNTIDVRGWLADDAASEVEHAVSLSPPGACLFVVHGLGTGRVRAAVHAALRRSRLVQRFEEQAESLGGCTVVYLRP